MKRSLSALVVGGSLMLMSGVATAQSESDGYGPEEPPPSTTTSSVLGTTIVPETTTTTGREVVATNTSATVKGVTATQGSLADTGQDTLPMLAAGAGLVGAGVIFVAASRRKGQADA